MSLLLCLTSDFTYFWIPECSKIQEGERSIILQGESSVTFEAKVGRSGGVGVGKSLQVSRSEDEQVRKGCMWERTKEEQSRRSARISRSDGGCEEGICRQ